jgi:hypothetical protein
LRPYTQQKSSSETATAFAGCDKKEALDLPLLRGPEGQQPKHQPSPEGLGIQSMTTLSAVGATLTLGYPLILKEGILTQPSQP